MAGYIIHIAIAKEYVRNHKQYNEEEFIKGTIAPDMVKDKTKTHFYTKEGKPNIEEFLKRYKVENSYYAGWLLHLLVDKEFHGNYLKDEEIQAEKLYQDYDILNEEMIEKYHLKIPKEIEQYATSKKGKLTYLKRETIYHFIEKMSKVEIRNIKR